jgi:hypothetical protein
VADLILVVRELPGLTPGLSDHRCEIFEALHSAAPKAKLRGGGGPGPGGPGGAGGGGAGGGGAGHGGLGAGAGGGQCGQQAFRPAPSIIFCACGGHLAQFVRLSMSMLQERLWACPWIASPPVLLHQLQDSEMFGQLP